MKCQALMAVACAIVLSTLGCAVDQASPDSDPLSEADEGASSPPEPPEDAAESPLEPDQLGSPQCGTDLVADRSLYFNDTEAMRSEDADSPFALRRALEAIIATSAYPFQSPEELLQSMMNDFTLLGRQVEQPYSAGVPDPDDGPLPVEVAGARLEAFLGAQRLLDPGSRSFMRPVALFNRIDLAPASAETCGEYRIVYAKRNEGGILSRVFNRFLLIFEAKLDNPFPDKGIEGCRPVAEFWADLSAMDSDQAAAELERFFFEGIDGFDPIVTLNNYRDGGQVRSNHFLTPVWQLREWTTAMDGEGRAHFAIEPVNNTPLAEYYRWGNPYSIFAPGKRRRFNELRDAFRADFLATQIPNLAAPETSGLPLDAFHITNGIAADPRPAFEDYQSNSQGGADQPGRWVDWGFERDIDERADQFGLSAGHVLNRAGAMTCGGCHQFSGGVEIAPGVNWPARAAAFAFVHVREDGELSPTLHSTFLPHRQTALDQFLCGVTPAPLVSNRATSALTGAVRPTH